MPESFDVFISYKREDQAFAERLHEQLIVWGYTVWMDIYNIPAGAYWPDEIDRGLNASQIVIGIISPCAVASRNVKNEWDWTIVNRKRLLLLMIEPCSIPINYISINYIDCVKDQAAGLTRLQTALIGPTPPPSPVDPYRDYLQALYDRINTYLAQTIIKVRLDDPRTPEPIPLRSERTPGAVDALFEKRDEIDPLFLIGGIKQEPIKLDGDFHTAFDYFDGRVLLLGEPGAGKTITLLHFGRDAVVQRIQDSSKPLPILAIISTWDAEKRTPLAEWLASSYGAPSDLARLVVEGRALMLLDGLDELGSERKETDPNNPNESIGYDPRQRFIEAITVNNKIIVTCRVKDYEEIGEKISLKGAVTLKNLSDEQIRDYLEVQVPDLWKALESDPSLRDMARTPLLLSLLAFGYKDQGEEAAKLHDLWETPGDLRDTIFQRYVHQRYEHEARKLRLRQPLETLTFTVNEIYEVLGRAVMVNTVDSQVGENALTLNDFRLPGERLSVFTELAVRLHLLLPGESGTFRFMHLLIRNHFAFLYALLQLRATDKDLRCYATQVLGRIRDVRAIEPLIAILRDTDDDVRRNAALALGQIGIPAVESLITILQSADEIGRSEAIVALGQIKDARAVEPLIAALHDSDEMIYTYAAIALGQIKDTRAIAPLITALNESRLVRFPALVGPESNRDTVGINTAAESLVQFGASAVEPLIGALQAEDVWIRHWAAYVLSKIGDVRAVEPLIATLGDNYWTVNAWAAYALVRIGVPAVEPLITTLHNADWKARVSAASALAEIGDARAVTPLIAALHDANEIVRAIAATALGMVEDASATEPLIAALHDASEMVRGSAALALGEIEDAHAVTPLVQLLSDIAKPWERKNERICDVAAEALEQIGTPEALTAVEAWRREQNQE